MSRKSDTLLKTEDVYLAAYLRIHDVPLVQVDLEVVEDYWFRGIYVFENTATVRDLVQLYGQPLTMVNLHNLRNYIEDVRYHTRRAVEERAPDDGLQRLMR